MADDQDDPGYRPLASKVEAMAGYGLSAAEIARVVDVDADELKASYEKELAGGHIKANARVAENLYRKATGDGREAVTAAIFWLKTRARWKETSVHEHGGADGGAITFKTIYEAEQFTEKIEQMAQRHQQVGVELVLGKPRSN
ncbi:MAG TPA: hypothetical protein VMF90_11315 [Rhizobiaceae bacterium]|nr:hypothetical protein [Rhizobiaceae bacterium]